MASYDILTDFKAGNDPDRLSFSAACSIAVFRRKWPVTYSRKKRGSISQDTSLVTDTKGVLVIIDDVTNVTVSSTKSNHISSLTAVLKPGLNYISELLPGDYVFCWMAQDKETIADIVKNLAAGKPCNNWMDGLKFFGKVSACRKKSSINPHSGTRDTRYMMSALGFGELDSKLYYEPYLQLPEFSPALAFLQYYGSKLNELIGVDAKGGVETDKIVPLVYRLLLGSGVPPHRFGSAASTDQSTEQIHATEGLDNPNIFILPQEVASVFGVKEGSKPNGQVGLVDVMQLVHGVHKFPEGGATPQEVFCPKLQDSTGPTRFTGNKLMGTFLPQLPAFTGAKPLWELMKQFVNSTVNEMYTALKVNADGKIMPTVTLWQLPFSSGLSGEVYRPKDYMSPENRAKERSAKAELEKLGGPTSENGMQFINAAKKRAKSGVFEGVLAPAPDEYEMTKFLELPRWRIPPIFVKGFDVGRSDAMRVNFIHIYGEAGASTGVKPVQGFLRSPPIKDDLDILRSGLRPYMATVPCGPTDVIRLGPDAWMQLMADLLMGQELTLTGTLDLHGIPQPISPGDNIEFDEVVAHIESIVHTFSLDPLGNPSFTTSLQLSRGMSADQADGTDFALFTGLNTGDMTTYDPAITRDGEGLTMTTGNSDDLTTRSD